VSEPTFWQVARRPQWILALLLVMALAGGFAWLGKWQLERAIISGQNSEKHVDDVVSLESLVAPGAGTSEKAAGHLVATTAILDRSSLVVIRDRVNNGELGFWLAGRLETPDGVLAGALGWAPTEDAVSAVKSRLSGEVGVQRPQAIEGRLMPSEAPAVPKSGIDPLAITTMSVAQLINVWTQSTLPSYSGYLVAKDAPEGLIPIVSTPPVTDATYNWLNIFYAIEWIVFAGFAFYVWYRLVRDRRERELDERKREK
jgi:surfeit locus 1 family protein